MVEPTLAERTGRTGALPERRPTRPAVTRAGASGEPLKVTEWHGDRGSFSESNQASLERHATRESMRSRETRPGALDARERAGGHANEAVVRLRQLDPGILDDQAGGLVDDRDGPALERLDQGHDRGRDCPPDRSLQDQDRELRQAGGPGPGTPLRGEHLAALLHAQARDDDAAHADRTGPGACLRD